MIELTQDIHLALSSVHHMHLQKKKKAEELKKPGMALTIYSTQSIGDTYMWPKRSCVVGFISHGQITKGLTYMHVYPCVSS
jgi:hypothetical protein